MVTRLQRTKRCGRRLFEFDRSLGSRYVAGADEAGRGCLAGPLVAAAVRFDYRRIGRKEVRLLGILNDSKQHTMQQRLKLYPLVLRVAQRVAVVTRCAPGIDARGLHRTNLSALRDALEQVACPECLCLSDGFSLGETSFPCQAVVGGDARSAAIAAASIVAKVTRDRFMEYAESVYPGWSFASNVGYGTSAHRAAIVRQGISPLHRKSFDSIAYQQLSLTSV